jgi:hypothetical protein
MDRTLEKVISVEKLSEITRHEVALYVAHSDTSKFFALIDDAQKLYAVVSVPHLPRPWPSRVVVMAQVVGDKVIIIEDNTDKPLVDALMVNGGVPRDQIILAYAGEPIPTP